MGVVAESPERRVLKPSNRGKPLRRPSLRDDSSPVKPVRKSKGANLPVEFAVVAARFASCLGSCGDDAPAPHVACLMLLLSCQYDHADVMTTMALATANVLRQAEEFQQMGDRERRFLAAIHIYLAHVFIFDECVPLRFWHEWAFSKYCTFGCLSRTLGKLLRLMAYRVTCDDDIVLSNMKYLQGEEDCALAAPLKGKW